MTTKEEKFFRNSRWFHGTTLTEWKLLCQSGIIANYNMGASLDFGCGFYLSPSEKDTQKYAMDTVKYNGSCDGDDNIPVVIEFEYSPYNDIISGIKYKYFGKYDNEFADFVFECRKNRMYHYNKNEITAGVMTDTIPTKLMQEFFAGIKNKEAVTSEFMKSTSKKQLCLHTQKLCDKLIIVKAYTVNGKELDVNEYKKR